MTNWYKNQVDSLFWINWIQKTLQTPCILLKPIAFQRWVFNEPDKKLYISFFIWIEYYSGMSWDKWYKYTQKILALSDH